MERRLTAILAADVVGYSRLMGLDEVGTLSALKTHRREMADGIAARLPASNVVSHADAGEGGGAR